MLIKTLQVKNFSYRQFILSPHQFGVPNRRIRYYLLARGPNVKGFDDIGRLSDEIITKNDFFLDEKFTHNAETSLTVKYFLNIEHDYEEDHEKNKNFYLSDKYMFCSNMCNLSSTLTNCFTKSYGKLFKGAGSTLYFDEKFEEVKLYVIKILEYKL
jgi:tRNA (cytosine38-C5)-methyltransferase